MGQKTLAVMKTKRHCVIVDFQPRYWALGVGFGKRNYHVQVGPIGVALSKRISC